MAKCPAKSSLVAVASVESMVAADDESGVDVLTEGVAVGELVVGLGALNCSMYATCSGVRLTVGADPYPALAAADDVGLAVVVRVSVVVAVSVSVCVWVMVVGAVAVTVEGSAVTVVGTVVVTVAVDGSVSEEESVLGEESVLDGAELSAGAVTVWVTVLGADGDIDSNGAHAIVCAASSSVASVSSPSICCC
jgi:hypothetical protein